MQRIERSLRDYSQRVATYRLMLRGISPEVIQPITIKAEDTATKESRAAIILGGVMIFVLMSVFFSGMNVAIDTAAGERERNSLEFLLAQPIATGHLVLAKTLTASTFAMFGAVLILIMIPLVFSLVPLHKLGIDFTPSLANLIVIGLTMVPLAIFSSALQLLVSFRAKSFKEAQTYISLVMIAPMLVVFAVEFTRTEHLLLDFLPITSQHQVLLSVIGGRGIEWLAVTVGSLGTLVIAAGFMWIVSRMLRSEKVVFGL